MPNPATPAGTAGTPAGTAGTPTGTAGTPTGAIPTAPSGITPTAAEGNIPTGTTPTPESAIPASPNNNPQGVQNTPNDDKNTFTKEQFQKLTQEINELRKFAEEQQFSHNIKQLEKEILDLETQFKEYGFNAEQTLQAMLADPRFQDKQLGDAMKANYSGALGVFKYWSENKKNISVRSEAGNTLDEETKQLFEKARKISDGELNGLLTPEDEVTILNHFINLKQGGK